MQTDSFHIFQQQLGARIQATRKLRGLSQEELAARLGMDRVSIGYIEQGKRAPKLSTLHSLAIELNVTLCDLFEGL